MAVHVSLTILATDDSPNRKLKAIDLKELRPKIKKRKDLIKNTAKKELQSIKVGRSSQRGNTRKPRKTKVGDASTSYRRVRVNLE